MTTIYLVTKHKIVNRFRGSYFVAFQNAFEIHDVFYTLDEAKAVAKNKDDKSSKYHYKVKKLVLKAGEA